MTARPAQDPIVRDLREQITEADRQILETVNRRVELVRRLHEYKAEHGYPLVDASREESLLDDLARRNPGPLSPEGLRELFRALIDISKREAAPRPAGSS